MDDAPYAEYSSFLFYIISLSSSDMLTHFCLKKQYTIATDESFT
jgi:hypothetical protein